MSERIVEDFRIYVEFLIHLTPLQQQPPALECYNSGTLKWPSRLLERCPIGIYSKAIESDLC